MPLLVKNDLVSLPPGVIDAIFFASAACGSLAKTVETCCSVSICVVHFGVNLIVAVADADGDDAAEEIEILVAVGVPDVLIFRARHDQRLLEIMKDRREKEFFIGKNDFVFCHRLNLHRLRFHKRLVHVGAAVAEKLPGLADFGDLSRSRSAVSTSSLSRDACAMICPRGSQK